MEAGVNITLKKENNLHLKPSCGNITVEALDWLDCFKAFVWLWLIEFAHGAPSGNDTVII